MTPNLDVCVAAIGAGCAGMLVGWLFANSVQLFQARPRDAIPRLPPPGRVMRIDAAASRIHADRERRLLETPAPVSRTPARERVCRFFLRAGKILYVRA